MFQLITFFLIGLFAAVAAGEQQKERTVLDGVYKEAQALKGEQEFEANCARCHIEDPEAPQLTGRSFIDRWREDSLNALFNHMSTRMPPGDPGLLGKPVYVQILAHLLHINDYPPGDTELTETALPGILLIGKNGPQPLPNNALVEVVGCLVDAGGATWRLAKATRPSRTRNGTEIAPEETKAAQARALGDRTFPLQNFTNIRLDFKPDSFKDHRVQIKGVLIRQTSGERIMLTAMQSLRPACE